MTLQQIVEELKNIKEQAVNHDDITKESVVEAITDLIHDASGDGFDFEFDVLCRFAKHNKKISEFYSEYSPRTYEEGKKIKPFKDGFTILKTIIRNYIKYQ